MCRHNYPPPDDHYPGGPREGVCGRLADRWSPESLHCSTDVTRVRPPTGCHSNSIREDRSGAHSLPSTVQFAGSDSSSEEASTEDKEGKLTGLDAVLTLLG